MSGPGPAQPATEPGRCLIHARAQAAGARALELRQQSERLLAQAQTLQQIIADARRTRRASPAGRERLQRSEYARLLARLETMPVIEQAKGIIMAQSHCNQADAFDMLRRASQRSNVPVRDLAAQIVANAAGTAAPPAGPGKQAGTPGHAGTRLLRAG